MEAASRGAAEAGGVVVGLLPGFSRSDANRWVTIPIVTGMDQARNVLLVRSCDAVLAIGGMYGTLSEIALALKLGIPVVGLRTWRLRQPEGTPGAAPRRRHARARPSSARCGRPRGGPAGAEVAAPEHRAAPRRAGSTSGSRICASATEPSPRWAACRSPSRPAGSPPSSGPRDAARPRCCARSPASSRVDAGHIRFGGEDVTARPPQERATAMVFQSYALWPHMTVFDNVAYGLRLRRVPRAQIARARAGRPGPGRDRRRRRRSRPASPARCRAASSSAWPSPARSSSSPACSCSTSPCRTSMPRCASGCARRSGGCSGGSASPRSTSPTIRKRPSPLPIRSR